MNHEEIAAIRDRCDAATPGPWIVHNVSYDRSSVRDMKGRTIIVEPILTDRSAELSFIAHARTDIPALLAELDHRDDLIADLLKDRGMVAQDELPVLQLRRRLDAALAQAAHLENLIKTIDMLAGPMLTGGGESVDPVMTQLRRLKQIRIAVAQAREENP